MSEVSESSIVSSSRVCAPVIGVIVTGVTFPSHETDAIELVWAESGTGADVGVDSMLCEKEVESKITEYRVL